MSTPGLLRPRTAAVSSFVPSLPLALTVGVALLGGVGYLDYETGIEWSFSIFYLAPVAFVTWYVGPGFGLAFALAGAAVWGLMDIGGGHVYSSPVIPIWNSTVRLTFFVVLSMLLSRLRGTLEVERRLGRCDFLTGVSNSRAFYEALHREIMRARRTRSPMTIASIDCDNFKYVNDTHGHQAGDALLREVAQTMAASIRQVDLVGRLGGDEFALLLPDVDGEQAKITIERLREHLLDTMRRNDWPVTFSIGAATFDRPAESLDAALHEADSLMYAAKTRGKNGVRYSLYS